MKNLALKVQEVKMKSKAAINRRQRAAAVPSAASGDRPGWSWVPAEPTKEMEDAAMRAITACDDDFRDEDARLDFRVSYREAIAAAPTPVVNMAPTARQ